MSDDNLDHIPPARSAPASLSGRPAPPLEQLPATVQLTDQQQRIVAHDHGPALVFAVAGAGKTTAMVHRVERLVREQIFAPRKILVSSFNKAAVEDIGRALAAWPHCRPVARQTLHALGYQIVREAARCGRLPRLARDALKVNGEERQILRAARDLARQRNCVPSGELDVIDEQDLLGYIGACKGNLRYPDLAAANLPPGAVQVATQAVAPDHLPWYLDLYRLYEEVRRARGWITFDDMLLLGWEALARNPDQCAHWQRSYDAVIVDEFQDVNLAQAEMLDLLTAPHRNYMAIGDDDQTIYGFRGASMRFFRDFERRYQAAIYAMTDNFRCQASQIMLANRVIAQNRERQPKAIVVTRGFGGATVLRRAADRAAMGRQMVADIAAARAEGVADAEIAILVRLTAQTPPVEQALIAAGIPYRIAGEEPFFRRREITDLLKYPELAACDVVLRYGQRLAGAEGERFVAAWRSVYNRPRRYLSRQFFQATVDAALHQGQQLSAVLPAMRDQVAEHTAAALQDLADLLVWLADAQACLPAAELLAELDWRLGYQDFLVRNSGFAETGMGYAANVNAFIQYARDKGTLADLLAHLAALETERAALPDNAPGSVDMRTIHKAKGLEWPVVLIPNCNDGVIPCNSADNEEERRLLYVAITRARRSLYLYALTGADAPLSPFLVAAGADATLRRAEEIARLLSVDPATWTAAEALSVIAFPREFGQERFFTTWWQSPLDERQRVVGRALAFIQTVTERGGAGKLGIGAADRTFWRDLAPAAVPSSPAFPGLDELCPGWCGGLLRRLPFGSRRT